MLAALPRKVSVPTRAQSLPPAAAAAAAAAAAEGGKAKGSFGCPRCRWAPRGCDRCQGEGEPGRRVRPRT